LTSPASRGIPFALFGGDTGNVLPPRGTLGTNERQRRFLIDEFEGMKDGRN